MQPRIVAFAITLVAICASLAPAAAASAAPPKGKGVLISHDGTWTFTKLGLPKIVVHAGKTGRGEVVVQRAFRLPKGVRQGPVKWFRILLHYEVDIAPDTGPGEIYFSANTDGVDGTSAQMIFHVQRLSSGEMSVTSSELGDVNGNVIRQGRQQVWRGEFENLMPYGGIRAGDNSFEVAVVHLRGDAARPARAVVYPDSAIVYGRIFPARFGLQLHVPPTVRVGERVPVQVTVTNLGRHRTEAGAVGVGFIPRSSASAPAVAALAPLPAGESRRITVYVTPEKPGDLRLFAGAHAGKSNNPRGHAVLHVVAGPAGFAWWWIPLAIAGLAVAALITLRIARGRA